MKQKAKNVLRPICLAMIILLTVIFTLTYTLSNELPDKFKVIEGSLLQINRPLPVKATYTDAAKSQKLNVNSVVGTKYSVDLKMFGLIPIKSAEVEVVDEMYVVPLGQPFGIKIFTQGVLIVGMTDVDSANGLINPARNAGLREGDIILSVNNVKINSNEEIAQIIENSEGKTLTLEVQRGGNSVFNVSFTPVKSVREGKYKAGIWVRDSSAGIGTLTFYCPSTGIAAGLGHGICDVDTGKLLTLNSGELVGAEIINIIKGKNGAPGELRGRFTDNTIGKLLLNEETGVYGRVNKTIDSLNLIPIAMKQEVVEGVAKILTTIDNNQPTLYDCVIEKVHFNDNSKIQNMIIKITDRNLLEKTGGIVQGMSGSPIIQNNKLVGAVTHVFVNDSARGYGIFAENMYQSAKSVAGN